MTFQEEAVFRTATFLGHAAFILATFQGLALFDATTFQGDAVRRDGLRACVTDWPVGLPG